MKNRFNGLKRMRLNNKNGFSNNISEVEIDVPEVKRNTLMDQLEDFQVEIEIENEPLKPKSIKDSNMKNYRK